MFTLFTFIFTQTQYTRFKTNKEAIIFTASVTVKSSPDEKSTDLFVVHEGLKIKITDTAGEWSEIKIANGSVGWIKTAVFTSRAPRSFKTLTKRAKVDPVSQISSTIKIDLFSATTDSTETRTPVLSSFLLSVKEYAQARTHSGSME